MERCVESEFLIEWCCYCLMALADILKGNYKFYTAFYLWRFGTTKIRLSGFVDNSIGYFLIFYGKHLHLMLQPNNTPMKKIKYSKTSYHLDKSSC